VFALGPATRIYLAAGATDMRKGFEGSYGLVRDRLLSQEELVLLLGGIDLSQAEHRRWHRVVTAAEKKLA
jgi:hypothetical protein